MTKFQILFIATLIMFSFQHASAMTIRNQISEAVKDVDVKRVRLLLAEHRDEYKEIYKLADEKKDSLLHEACTIKCDRSHNDRDSINDIIKELLFCEYDVNAQNKDNDTPFHYINKGTVHPERRIVKWFFKSRANPNIKNDEGNTPFHYLLAGKISPEEQEGTGYSRAIIKLFLDKNANPNIQNDQGNTPFHQGNRIKKS